MGTTMRGMTLAVVSGAAVAVAHAQVDFVEVGAARGIGPYQMAGGMVGGVAAADFDNDGDIDVFVPNAEGVPDQLYRNLGDGTFEEIGAAAGVAATSASKSAIWIDYDGDNLLDLFVMGDCFMVADPTCPNTLTIRLYRQVSPGVFQDVTLAAGMTDDNVTNTFETHRGGTSAADINGDGYLDILSGVWKGNAQVWVNNGDGTFHDGTAAAGLNFWNTRWQSVWIDFDGDGDQDVFQAIDFTANELWMNQGNGSFVNMAAAAGADIAWNDMGVAAGDYDNDGDFDLYITEVTQNLGMPGERYCVLLRNDTENGQVQFTDVSKAAGVHNAGWGWGATWIDCDNDGLLDLAMTNGFDNPGYGADQSHFFLNMGDGTFLDVSADVGHNDTYWGSSLIAFDYDRDGDLDMLQTTTPTAANPGGGDLRLLENQPGEGAASNHYLVVRPRMPFSPNKRAIGAVVRVLNGSVPTGFTLQSRTIGIGTSFAGQEPAEAHFGLGANTAARLVIVEWPDGSYNAYFNVAADQVITVERPATDCPGDLNGDGVIGGPDANGYKLLVQSRNHLADCDGNGLVNVFDWFCFKELMLETIQSGGCP